MRFLEEPLRSLKNRYFDPAAYMEYFERYGKVRSALKESYGKKFDDLVDRPPPQSSGTSDFEGRGYFKRAYLEQLFDDCRYAVDLLETVSEDKPNMNSAPSPANTGGNEIFISHASADKELMRLFVERVLRLGLDLKSDSIFCTSLEGMDIKNGEDFREQIRAALRSAKIVILIITPNYKASEVCQNEMGAAWYSDKRVIPLIVEPISYKSVGVLMEPKQIPRIADATALSKLKDDITQELGLTFTKTTLWDAGKEAFLTELPTTLAKIKFPKTKTEKEIAEIETENTKLKQQIATAGIKITQLQAKYETLTKEKGADATKKVEEQFDDRTPLEKFEQLTTDVRSKLRPFPRVVQAVILCDFFNQTYSPPVRDYRDELNSAERKNQISFDDGKFSVNSDHRDVKALETSLKALQKFLGKETDNSFPELYEKEFKSPLEPDNEDFWEEHFELSVPT